MNNFEIELRNKPLKDILIENKVFDEELPMDEYHLIMAQTDFLSGIHNRKTVKTYFYRSVPFDGSYIITTGLAAFLAKLHNFSYKQIVPYLKNKNYNSDFINYVSSRDKIEVVVYAIPENSPAFPHEPIIILESNLLDSRILEGIILSELNFPSLVATKWHRILNVVGELPTMEFGRRRAQNSLKASLYSYIAGVNASSNCEANGLFGIPVSGTMGHEYVQSFTSEFEAFDKWLEINPLKPCLLIDTINTLDSGIVNAIKAFKKHKDNLVKLNSWDKICVRIDSGDLAYLAVECYNKLSSSLNTENVTIVLSNDLDEYNIESIFSQLNQANKSNVIKRLSFGIGTKAVTAWGEPALGGVCKISEIDDSYILKISNYNEKTTIPGNLRSSLVTDEFGQFITCLLYFKDEDLSLINKFMHINDERKFIIKSDSLFINETRQKLVYKSNGESFEFLSPYGTQSIEEIRNNINNEINKLDWYYKRLVKPHRVKVSLSPKLFNIRKHMMSENLLYMKK